MSFATFAVVVATACGNAPDPDPTVPLQFDATADVRSVELSWSPPVGPDGVVVSEYIVGIEPSGETEMVPASRTSLRIDGLANGTRYTFSVAARSDKGRTGPATSATVTTPDVPSAPSQVSASERVSAARVTWAPSSQDGGRPITHYTVTASPGGAFVTVGPSATAATVEGLETDVPYTFSVVASNAVGTSAPASASSPLSLVVPGPVRSLATSDTWGLLVASWLPPDQGAPATAYEATATPGGVSQTVYGTSAAFSGLPGGVMYTVTVRPLNASGAGEARTTSAPLRCVSWSFATPVLNATAAGSLAAGSADFDQDGHTDVAVSNSTANSVSVLLGNGDGTFDPKVDYAIASAPAGMATGDLNADGRADVVVAHSMADVVSLLLGAGDGTLLSPTTLPMPGTPQLPTLADFDNDSDLDLAVSNSTTGFSLFLGNGDGTFADRVDTNLSSSIGLMAAADLDADGNLDLVAGTSGSAVLVLLGNGDGTFKDFVSYPGASGFKSVAAGDFNGDGHIDLAVTARSGSVVSVFLGVGDGTVAAKVDYPTALGPQSVTIADFDFDRRLDLAVSHFSGQVVSVLRGNGDGTFGTRVDYPATGEASVAAAADFNEDGRLDLATPIRNGKLAYFAGTCAP